MLITTNQRKKLIERLMNGGVPLTESNCVCNRFAKAGIAAWGSDDVLRLTKRGRKTIEQWVEDTKKYFAKAQRRSRKRKSLA